MKKTSTLTKILLSLVLVALVFAIVACTPSDDNNNKKPKDDTKKEELTLSQQVVEIVNGVGPILDVINNAKADGTLGASIALAVDYNIDGTQDRYELGIKANANATNPGAQISFKQSAQEWFNLTYVDSKAYLVQPATALNTKNKVDSVMADLTALNPAVQDIMYIAMDVIAGLELNINTNDIADSVDELLQSLGQSIGNLLTIQSSNSGYSIVLGSEIMGLLQTMLPSLLGGTINGLVGEDLGGQIMGYIKDFLGTEGLELSISIGFDSNKAINGLEIGYKMGSDSGKIDLDLELSSSAIAITAPSAGNKALNIGLDAALGQKGLSADLDIYGAANLAKDGNNLAFAELALNGANKSYAAFNGTTAAIDIAGMLDFIGDEGAASKYKATIQTRNNDGQLQPKSVVELINGFAAEAKADYIAGKASNADEAEELSMSIEQTIYTMLGGELELNSKGDAYKEVTEKQMMALVDSIVGDYVRFAIDTESKENNYLGTVKNIIALFADNQDWIVGHAFVDKEKLEAVTSFGDLVKFGWFDTEATGDDAGIFNWDTTTYSGGVVLTKPGEHNDLLDAVNVFVALGKEDGEYVDIDAKLFADLGNYYLAALGYYFGVYDSEEMAMIDQIDLKYEYAKFQYDQGAISEEDLAAAKEEHKAALSVYYTEERANEVLQVLLGTQAATEEMSELEALIAGGLELHLGSTPNAGINGFIELRSSVDTTVSYVKIAGNFNVVDNTIDKMVEEAGIDYASEDYAELYAPETITSDSEYADAYKVIATTSNGVKEVNYDEETGSYSYNYLKVDDEFVYSDRYENGEDLLTTLGEVLGMLLMYEAE